MSERSFVKNKARRERTHLASSGLSVRSGLEKTFADTLDAHHIPYSYEQDRLPYVVPVSNHKYLVDFTIKGAYVETKGRLTGDDRKKMLLVKEQHPDALIVFVFSNKNKKLYKNSKTSYAGWCEKHGFNYLDIKEVKENPQLLFTLKPKAKPNVKKRITKRRLQDLCHP